ncbi:sodium/proton antiporter, partial [Salmonella enterica subsp. enterica serovar Weltevreden]|nr:sodium/proton antiporter [Salmonella enterica subsp. enterica serovar Weltevreden]
FFLRMSPVTVPVLVCGLLPCMLVEKRRWFGYGETLPEQVRDVLQQFDDHSRKKRTRQDKIKLIVPAIIGVWLVTALALHL